MGVVCSAGSGRESDVQFDEAEWDFRQRRYEQIREQVDDLPGRIASSARRRAESRPELDRILEDFTSSGDAEALKLSMDRWSRSKPDYGFAGPNGAMFLNQLVNDSSAADIVPLLHRAIRGPRNDDDAESMFAAFVTHTEKLRTEGSAAAVGRVAPLLTWFWWLNAPETWPMQWRSAVETLQLLGFVDEDDHWTRYSRYRDHVRRFADFEETEQVLGNVPPEQLGLDTTTTDRCTRIGALAERASQDSGVYDLNRVSVGVLRANMKLIGKVAADAVGSAIGRDVRATIASEFTDATSKSLREDCWVYWRPQHDGLTPFFQLVADQEGIKAGLYASSQQTGGKGYAKRVTDELADAGADDSLAWLAWGIGAHEGKSGTEWPSWSLLGRSFTVAELANPARLQSALADLATELRPLFQQLWNEDTPIEPGPTVGAVGATVEQLDPDVSALAKTFVDEVGYPTDEDKADLAQRARWAANLAPGRLASLSVDELRRLYNGGAYGNPGPQSILNTTLRDAESATFERLLTAIEYLLWDTEDDYALRINRVMDEDDLGLRGFKESVIMKLLAVAHPERFLPIFPFTNKNGKAALLTSIGGTPPAMSKSVGERHVESNDALRTFGELYFPDDAWAQKQFIYWLRDREDETGAGLDEPIAPPSDPIGAAAESLHLPRVFLEEVQSLLVQHKQVVFYGPPGTGKTFVAQHLAEALAPSEEQRLLIQFHPSTSYEDFFEGFRPVSTGDDGIAYRLIDGPLKIMAERASTDPRGRPHILIIDEINRANLAKVLGELLFLLEYRDREIQPLYRPEEPFSLPKNLWIIGTMNTADRSIATVDAALRRRFHFVPFIPDDREMNPISGLLDRWLDDNGGDEWISTLVDGVNQRLRKELGGDHLLIGPSYFMVENLDEAGLEQIWKYQIEPLVDDLFFGSDKAKTFHFAQVWKEFGPEEATE